jgi:hypothetical protein
MVDRQVFRYTDPRGDTIIYKFDPDLLHHPTESPITIFHEWRQDFHNRIQLTSTQLDKESAIERCRKDKRPAVGTLLWEGKDDNGRWIKCRFVPFERNERGFVIE